jgi:hypothetical protein
MTTTVITRNIVALFLLLMVASNGAAQSPQDPKPENAIPGILASFDRFRVVAIGDFHGTKDLNDFVLSLIRHPDFPDRVNDIVIEGFNSFLQSTADRYVAGENVPIEVARKLWRDGTIPVGVSDFQAQLFQLVRRINQTRPPAQRLRVVAGEPPVDWSKASVASYDNRDEHIAAVIASEVLAKNRKALVFYGASHLVRGVGELAVQRYEQKYPGVTFVITPYVGVIDGERCGLPAFIDGVSHEAKMAAWPVPSLVRTQGTWLTDFKANNRQRPAAVTARGVVVIPPDAYLYLGPPRLLLSEQRSAVTFADKNLIPEYQRRLDATGANQPEYVKERIDPDKARELDTDVLRCPPVR